MAKAAQEPTEVIEPQPGSEEAPARRTRRGRAARGWLIAAVVLIALVAAFVVADNLARAAAEERVAEEVEARLPEGVEGDVEAKIGGFSVIAQYLLGTAERVELSSSNLTVDGAPLSADIVAVGVPVNLDEPVRRIDATIRLDEDAVNQLVGDDVPGGFSLEDGTVGYDGTVDVLGVPVQYTAAAEPVAAGGSILLVPAGVTVSAGGVDVDASGIVDRILGGDPLAVCVADRLPEGVEVTALAVEPGEASVRLTATDLRLDAASLARYGTCG